MKYKAIQVFLVSLGIDDTTGTAMHKVVFLETQTMSLGIFQLIYCIRQTRSIASEVMSLDLVSERSSRVSTRTHYVTNEKRTFVFVKCTTLVISGASGGGSDGGGVRRRRRRRRAMVVVDDGDGDRDYSFWRCWRLGQVVHARQLDPSLPLNSLVSRPTTLLGRRSSGHEEQSFTSNEATPLADR